MLKTKIYTTNLWIFSFLVKRLSWKWAQPQLQWLQYSAGLTAWACTHFSAAGVEGVQVEGRKQGAEGVVGVYKHFLIQKEKLKVLFQWKTFS